MSERKLNSFLDAGFADQATTEVSLRRRERQLELLRHRDDPKCVAALIETVDPFIASCARKAMHAFNFAEDYFDDFVAEGRIGAMRAVQIFEESYDCSFFTFAFPHIKQRIWRHGKLNRTSVYVPVNHWDKSHLDQSRFSDEEKARLQKSMRSAIVGIDDPIGDGALTLANILPHAGVTSEADIISRDLFHRAAKRLNDRERFVVDKTLCGHECHEIAEMWAAETGSPVVSRERIRQLQVSSHLKLVNALLDLKQGHGISRPDVGDYTRRIARGAPQVEFSVQQRRASAKRLLEIRKQESAREVAVVETKDLPAAPRKETVMF